MSNQAVIIDATRSPIGVKNGEMVGIRPDDLAAQVVKGLMNRNPAVKLEEIEDLVMGCAFPEGPQGMLIGRSVSVLAGLPQSVPGKVVNRFCGSAMDALHQVSAAIESGDIDVGIAAGVEDMFSIPPGGFAPDFHPELAEQEYYIGMGETAETDVEKIRSLNPAFVEGGSVTAATSSPFSLGAAALLVTSQSFAEKNGLTIRATIASRAVAGVDWTRMGMGPIPATEKALKKAGLAMEEIEVIELNEAFAAQALYVIQEGGWDASKVNLNGGAVALGHPLGSSGARIVGTLINVMEQHDYHTGLATMCIGSGQGIATIIKRP